MGMGRGLPHLNQRVGREEAGEQEERIDSELSRGYDLEGGRGGQGAGRGVHGFRGIDPIWQWLCKDECVSQDDQAHGEDAHAVERGQGPTGRPLHTCTRMHTNMDTYTTKP